jgi:hypothetical protein
MNRGTFLCQVFFNNKPQIHRFYFEYRIIKDEILILKIKPR